MDGNVEFTTLLHRVPLEVRCMIYRNLLSTEETKQPCVDRGISPEEIHAKFWPGHTYRLDSTILRTCRQIYDEAFAMLYHRNTFICVRSANEDLSHVMDIQGIPILLEGRQAERFTHCAMTVDFDHRNRRRSTRCREDKSCYIIALADLELLCPSLLIQYNLSGRKFHEYKFKISVHRPLDNSPRSSQFLHRLLEPFTILHSLSHFDIVCPTNRQYCTSIATQVSRPPPTQSEVVGTVAMFENTGYHHLARNDFQRAIKYYKLAFAQHMYPFCPQQRVMQPSDRPLHEQQDLIAETTCMLPAALSNAHFEAREYNDALYWAVLALANRPPGDDTPRKWEINAYLARLMVQASEALMGIEDEGDRIEDVIL